jgi:peptidoglycan/xylan/chitin deacetylase (PgdA/CDA1 family)
VESRRERVLRRSGAAALLRRLPSWRGVLVLGYHRIGDHRTAVHDPNLYSATAEDFGHQLDLLADTVEVVAPSRVPSLRGRHGRHVALTFDDGYRDNHELALPALEARGMTAAFFLPTGYLDRPRIAWWDEIAWMVRRGTAETVPAGRWLEVAVPLGSEAPAVVALTDRYKRIPAADCEGYLDFLAEATGAGRAPAGEGASDWMTWDMARDMRARGMEIGGHSIDHPVLARLDERGQEREVAGCLARLRDELGEDVTLFSYPVGIPGAFDDVTKGCLRRAGIQAAFALAGGYVSRRSRDALALPRTAVHHSTTQGRLAAQLAAPALYARW